MEELKAENDQLREENRMLRNKCGERWAALRFYADPKSWEMHPRRFRKWGQTAEYCYAQEDAGQRARKCSDPDTEIVQSYTGTSSA